jgi:hypothetical protein
MRDEPIFRYILESKPNVSYSENELMKSNEKETRYKVKEILGEKKIKGVKHVLVWFQGYKKKDATWLPESDVI